MQNRFPQMPPFAKQADPRRDCRQRRNKHRSGRHILCNAGQIVISRARQVDQRFQRRVHRLKGDYRSHGQEQHGVSQRFQPVGKGKSGDENRRRQMDPHVPFVFDAEADAPEGIQKTPA